MKIKALTKDAYRLFHEGSIALAAASRNGMRLDLDYCKKKMEELDDKMAEHDRRFWHTKLGKRWDKKFQYKSKITSDLQLREMLFNEMGLTPSSATKKKQAPSVDYESLSGLLGDVPELRHVIGYKKKSKLMTTYLGGFMREQVGGIIHPSFNLHLVKTFRSSSDKPNFQNNPKRDKEAYTLIRSAILARPGHQIVAVDFSGVEVRIAACYHRDPTMLDYINDPTTDMHKDMAVQLYVLDDLDKTCPGERHLRYGAKNGFVFPQFYGDYYGNNAPTLLKHAEGRELSDGTPVHVHLQDKGLIKLDKHGRIKSSKKFISHVQAVEEDFWENRFQEYNAWKKRNYRKYQKNGYVDLFTGFRCSGVMSKNEVNNYPVQGAAFHCLLWSLNRTYDKSQEENWDSRLTGQIHDEMVLDTLPDERDHVLKTIQDITCNQLPAAWDWIITPIEVDASVCPVDGSWAEAEDMEI